MTTVEQYAERALELPDSYFVGSDDEGVTWGRIGVSYNRDSGPRSITIAECVYERLHDQFPNDVDWQRSHDFAFGWCREIMVRVKTDAGEITDAFTATVEFCEGLNAIEAFESEISAAEHEATINNISNSWSGSLRYPDEMLHTEAHEAVYKWLSDSGIQAGGDDGTWYSREEVELAGLHLGFWDIEYTGEEEFFDRIQAEGSTHDFRRWCYAVWREEHERTQGVLFDS